MASETDRGSVEMVREPLIIYRDILIPLMKSAGFELVFDTSDDRRYHSRFTYARGYLEEGVVKRLETQVDVVGIPIGQQFLILHGIIVGTTADETDDVKVKIRCCPLNGGQEYNNGENRSLPSGSTGDYTSSIYTKLQTEFVYKLIELLSLKLDDLPLELRVAVLARLPVSSLLAMSRVNSQWRELALDDQLWRILTKKYFPECYERRVEGQSWRVIFKDEYRRKRYLEHRRHLVDDLLPMAFALPPPFVPLAIGPPPFYPMLPAPLNWRSLSEPSCSLIKY